MKFTDKQLGMNASISRRDFLNGVSVAIGASLLPQAGAAMDSGRQDLPGYYPPTLTGMRGSHAGSFETAHMARDGMSWRGAEDLGERYDLVVVGGGLSGLSAAYFYQQAAGPGARILVLDNHDDFGGHAKRNEFEIDGRTLIGYGGTQSLEAPGGYPEIAKKLIRELGIDTQKFYTYFDRKLYGSLGLSRGTFFDEETFGGDYLAVGSLTNPKTLKHIPISDAGKADLQRLMADDRHYLADIPAGKRLEYLQRGIAFRRTKQMACTDQSLDGTGRLEPGGGLGGVHSQVG